MSAPGTTQWGPPRPPDVADDLHSAYVDAHESVHLSLHSLSPAVRDALVLWQREQQVLSLASIRPTRYGGTGPALFPERRRFLDAPLTRRARGVEVGLRHVEHRISRVLNDASEPLLQAETPYVLNALTEGREDRSDVDTHAGLVRARGTAVGGPIAAYGYAPGERARELSDSLLATARTLDASPVAVGLWVLFGWLSIHPFRDGNGRTSRLLHLLISGPELPLGLDLGLGEIVVFRRTEYRERLIAGQAPPVDAQYDGRTLEPRPFVEAMVRWSVEGAMLFERRIRSVATARDVFDVEDDTFALVLAVWLRGRVRPGELGDAILRADLTSLLRSLEDLVGAGLLARHRPVASHRKNDDDPDLPAYGVTEAVDRLIWSSIRESADEPVDSQPSDQVK